jgi:hypothetical protein
MNPTSRAILQTVIATDSSLTNTEREAIRRLVTGESQSIPAAGEDRLLVTQKRAAELMSVNRVTIWRMAKESILHPVAILPGMWR